jgi:hypothetical protein
MRLADAFGDLVAPRLPREVVDLIARAPERIRTMRGTIRDWANYRLIAKSLGNPWSSPDEHESGESAWHVWYELPTSRFNGMETPHRLRVGKKVRPGEVDHLAIRDGDRWGAWSRSALKALHDDGGRDARLDLCLHVLAPTWIFSDTVVAAGEQKRLGRDALELHDPEGTWFLGPDADAARYLIDAERGVLLRAEVVVDGESASVEEVVDIAFDEPLDASLFDGGPGRKATGQSPVGTVSSSLRGAP